MYRRWLNRYRQSSRRFRELPDMMSATKGGGGSWKGGHNEGGCVVEYIADLNVDKVDGGGGQKIRKFCGRHICNLPY